MSLHAHNHNTLYYLDIINCKKHIIYEKFIISFIFPIHVYTYMVHLFTKIRITKIASVPINP
jgi:hypothetical protein